MSDRFTVGRDMPHGTGVESTIQWLSNQKSVSVASSRIAFLTSGNAARSRLLYPGRFGMCGNIAVRLLQAKRSQRASEVKPSRACATARHTSSESLNRGGLPSHRVPPISSSIFTYSPVMRASKSSFVTKRSWTPSLCVPKHPASIWNYSSRGTAKGSSGVA